MPLPRSVAVLAVLALTAPPLGAQAPDRAVRSLPRVRPDLRLSPGLPGLPGEPPGGRPDGVPVTLQHDDGTARFVLNSDADDIELVKFCPEGRGTIRAIRLFLENNGLPATVEVHVWANYGNYNVDWARDLSGSLTFTATVAGWNEVPLPPDGIRFDAPPCFWVGSVHSGAISPRILTDDEACLGGGAECTTSFLAAQAPGTYCLPNDQLSYVLLSDDCNGDGTTGDWSDVDYLLRVDFDPDDEVTPVFTDVTDAVGMPRSNLIAWGDHDGDGDDDALLGGQLWENDGAGGFTNVSATAFPGVGSAGGPGLWGDPDNDGDLDIFSYGRTDRLWRNEGDGTFTDVTATSGDIDDGWPTDAGGWADFDRDGLLDFFKANYEDWNGGNPIYYPDVLLHNNGDGTFSDVSSLAGIYDEAPIADPLAGRGVNWGDYDGDGWPDLHVSNYRLTPNLLYHNNGDGTFENVADANGVQGTLRTGAYAGAFGHTIGSQWGDHDNDGDLDLLQGQLKHQWGRCFQDPTFLWRNDGGGTFTEIHDLVPIEYQEGHSDVCWGDVDNDGDLDFYITHVYACQPAQLYLNDGNGTTFRNVTAASGLLTSNGWGVAFADVDGDGDLDAFTRGLWRNDGPTGNWLKVRLSGTWSNAAAIGAGVRLDHLGTVQYREVEGGKGTGTQSSLTQHFGLAGETTVERLTVTWPSDCTPTVVRDLPANATLELAEPCGVLRRGVDPRVLLDLVRWDPRTPVTDADVLPERVRYYRSTADLLLRVGKDAASDAVITGEVRVRLR